MQRRHILAGLPAAAIITARPASAAQPVVLELFTSQSCNSCPPADALLLELIRDRPDVLALSYHVTYWDRLGWRDRFSLQAATDRQRRYAALLREGRYPGQVYTPQLVIQGQRDAIGSERAAVLAALRAVAGRSAAAPALAVTSRDAALTIELGHGEAAGSLWLIGYDPRHVTEIRGGENGGRTLAYGNVVRSIAPLGAWQGAPQRIAATRGAGERVAVLLQAADGAILAAASA